MRRVLIGSKQKQPGGYSAFVPSNFPPADFFPFPDELVLKSSEASRYLGKLDGITRLLPDADFFLLMYLRKDAASSSQIEGTSATLVDALKAEGHFRNDLPEDVDDILHYLKALHYGMERVSKDEFPVSLRLVRELHDQLIRGARVTHFSAPGEFRKSQNWISGTRPDNARFVPPPVEEMERALGQLEVFIHAKDNIPFLLKAGMIHAQFETIHPFLDGNGRTGRMLVTIYLWSQGYLERPVLFLSSYFKAYRDVYFDRLSGYCRGEVFEWLDFFLDGVIEIAREAISIAEKITKLRQRNLDFAQGLGKREAESAVKVLNHLYAQPIVNVNLVKQWTGFTRDGAYKLISRYVDYGILEPLNKDRKYGQSYIYKEYVELFLQDPGDKKWK